MELSVCITRTLSTKDSLIGQHKTAELVIQALSQINAPLSSITLFHSDRGKEFDNQLLDSCFEVFGITRSLSHKGYPYDNAVADATFKTIKTEFVKNKVFTDIMNLDNELKQ